MQKIAIYGIIIAIVVAAGVGVAFAAMSMNNTVEPAVANQQRTDDNQVRVIKHAMGETEITGTPERVVVLYSIYAGDVRALGVQPVGIVDRDWINGWLTPIGYPLSEDVANVGIPNEPNLETILQLEPDLIIGLGGKWGEKHIELYDEFSEIAPTLLFNPDPRPELDELEVAKQNFMSIADALNRRDEGISWLENMEAHYDEAANKIEQAGYKGAKVVLTTAYLQDDVPQMFIFTEGAFATLLLNKLGLVNEIPDPADTTDTWYRTGMEGLTTVDGPDVHLIVSYNAGQYDTSPLEKSPLWDNLDFVKNDHVHDIGNTRLFGQVLFAEDIANRVVNAMTSDNDVRVIKHDMGETEITGTPERVILLDAQSFSIMMELGIEPVGVQTWEKWFFDKEIFWEEYYPGIAQEWPDVVNVGRGEPNLEIISQLEPDLIIAPIWGAEIYDDLSEIAPTILFTGSPPEDSGLDNLEAAERYTMGIADALNRHDEGVAMIERFHAKLDEAESKLEAAGLKGKKFIFSQLMSQEDGSFNERVWADTSKPSLMLEGMGLVNAAVAPEGIAPTVDGRLENVGFEGLSTMDGQDVHFIYMPTGDDPVTTIWQDNPVWNNLEFVKAGQVYSLESNLYMFGGPQKDAEFVDRVVEVLTSGNS